MKILNKIIILLMFSVFATKSFAEISVGFKAGSADLDATDTTATTLNKKTRSASSEFAALFIEGKLPIDAPINVSLGLEYIPITATLSANATNRSDATRPSGDYSMDVSNHTTIYASVSKDFEQGFNIFGKVGYVRADISDVRTNTSALTSKDDELTGVTYGIGVQKNLDLPLLSFLRLGYDYIEYDTVEAKSSSTTYKGDAEAETIYLSLGKTF